MNGRTIEIGGPYFEDFAVGQELEQAPAITIHEGHAAFHQALFHDRLRLPLDAHLSRQVTGHATALVNPSLMCNIAIGQTTYASQRVKANLFYRGLVLKHPVFLHDTLYTHTKVVGLRQNKKKTGREATGVVALEMLVSNQDGAEVMKFWRCPMIPCLNTDAETGHADRFEAIPESLDMQDVIKAAPQSWNYEGFKQLAGLHFEDVEVDDTFKVMSRDTVTNAPELVRFTLNMAMTHTDATTSAYKKRLVYGGHTISMAAALLSRALPNIVTLLAWRSCDHTGPVFENDILGAEIKVVGKHPLDVGGILDLHILIHAERGDQAPEPGKDIPVLDWKLLVYVV